MSSKPEALRPDNVVRHVQIILSLLIGATLLLGVFTVLMRPNRPVADESPLTWAFVVFGVCLPLIGEWQARQYAWRKIPEALHAPPEEVATRLSQTYVMKTIVGSVFYLVSAFLNLRMFYMESHPVSLGTALAVTALLAVRMPTQSRFDAWFEQVQRTRD